MQTDSIQRGEYHQMRNDAKIFGHDERGTAALVLEAMATRDRITGTVTVGNPRITP